MTKDAGNFLRKVAKFVANPTTNWSELDSAALSGGESEYAKAEIKAMIERKRRNDFVRKRELDMLRKIRREGLSHDSALALATPSNLDSESRANSGGGPKSDVAVKAKIDAIEQQMVGGPDPRDQRRASAHVNGGTTTPADLGREGQPPVAPVQPVDGYAATRPFDPTNLPTQPMGGADAPPQISDEVLATARANLPRLAGEVAPRPAIQSPISPNGFAHNPGVEVCEVGHDPDMDEAVIAFANADFEQCERDIMALIQPGGLRHEQADSWMMLFDLYRALDLPTKFEALAVSFVHQFGLSAPQWYSLPERVSRHLAQRSTGGAGGDTDAPKVHPNESIHQNDAGEPILQGWIAPPHLDADAIGRLRCEVLQLPRPWAMDWLVVASITPEAAALLTAQLQTWAKDTISLTWIGVDHLLDVLQELSPTGDRDADPAIWMLRLELLRLGTRPDQFDETAIDYCVTYELSPPSWEKPRCTVKLVKDATCTQTVTLSHIGDISTSFVESQLHDDVEFIQQASLELSGQLIGDIGDTLSDLDNQLGSSVAVQLDCMHLIRVDFIAAGDLLNWVLARTAENRQVTFVNPHRLVALFFGAMGITEHAKVKLQLV